MTNVIEKIKSRGYWKIVIRPTTFNPERVQELASLETIVRDCTVSLRSWDFPQHDASRLPPVRGTDWTGQELDWHDHVEMWRAYKSGQFVAMFAPWREWLDQSKLPPPDEKPDPGTTLSVEDTVFRFTEIFEFAARYSNTVAGDEHMRIEIELEKLVNRKLVLGPNKVGFAFAAVAHVESWQWGREFARSELLAKTRELALVPAISLFEIFGWDTNKETLRNIQNDLRK